MEKLQDLSDEYNGDKATHYELEESITHETYKSTHESKFIIVSTSRTFGLETYVFLADEGGNFITMTELPESQKGMVEHDKMAERVEERKGL